MQDFVHQPYVLKCWCINPSQGLPWTLARRVNAAWVHNNNKSIVVYDMMTGTLRILWNKNKTNTVTMISNNEDADNDIACSHNYSFSHITYLLCDCLDQRLHACSCWWIWISPIMRCGSHHIPRNKQNASNITKPTIPKVTNFTRPTIPRDSGL